MLKLDNPTCQKPTTGTVSERSLWAENMAATHTSKRCSKHQLFHNWEPISNEDVRAVMGRRAGVRLNDYYEVSPGKWLPRNSKLKNLVGGE